MHAANPTPSQIREMLSFIPILEEFQSKRKIEWTKSYRFSKGAAALPNPIYPPEVNDFFRLASKPCWRVDYDVAEANALLDKPSASITLDQFKNVITACARGERFCDGLWASLLGSGRLVRFLKAFQKSWLEKSDRRE
jgi:hypothetical protein